MKPSLRRGLRKASLVGRFAAVAALLAVLYWSTVQGVDRATDAADDRRLDDRVLFGEGFADAVGAHFAAGAREAEELAGAGTSQAAVDDFLGAPRVFTREVLVVDGGLRVLAASGRQRALLGRVPSDCVRGAEDGSSATDVAFRELVAEAASGAPSPRILDVPGSCDTAVGIARRAGGATVVVLGEPADLAARLTAASLVPDGEAAEGSSGSRAFVVDPFRRVIEPSRDGAVLREAPPPRVAALLDSGEGRDRYPLGEDGNTEVVGVAHGVEGWDVVLEQDAAVFDLAPQERPSAIVAGVLTLVFGIVLALVALFDWRRQRAHRRGEEAKNAFFSVVGHELRTPLTSLKGFLETLDARWDDVNDDRRKALVERMLPQARRLDRLVDRLMTGASIQAGTHTHPQVGPVDLVPLLEGVPSEFEAEAPLHRFVVKVQRDLPEVTGDPRALTQVLVHLVDNAVKYSPEGGRVLVGARTTRRGVEIVVDDEGVGLPSDATRIFEPLSQGEDVTKRVHDEGGTGLGLYIVRTLVAEMGGSVRAERKAKGARFVVRLKAARTRTKTPVRAQD